jgi:hypothetical protein
MSTVDALKLFSRIGKIGYYAIIVYFDIFFWGFSGLMYYAMTNNIESWSILDSFSMAWKGMFQPIPFVIGHSIGLLFW